MTTETPTTASAVILFPRDEDDLEEVRRVEQTIPEVEDSEKEVLAEREVQVVLATLEEQLSHSSLRA